jgi:hypothetical protein
VIISILSLDIVFYFIVDWPHHVLVVELSKLSEHRRLALIAEFLYSLLKVILRHNDVL